MPRTMSSKKPSPVLLTILLARKPEISPRMIQANIDTMSSYSRNPGATPDGRLLNASRLSCPSLSRFWPASRAPGLVRGERLSRAGVGAGGGPGRAPGGGGGAGGRGAGAPGGVARGRPEPPGHAIVRAVPPGLSGPSLRDAPVSPPRAVPPGPSGPPLRDAPVSPPRAVPPGPSGPSLRDAPVSPPRAVPPGPSGPSLRDAPVSPPRAERLFHG